MGSGWSRIAARRRGKKMVFRRRFASIVDFMVAGFPGGIYHLDKPVYLELPE